MFGQQFDVWNAVPATVVPKSFVPLRDRHRADQFAAAAARSYVYANNTLLKDDEWTWCPANGSAPAGGRTLTLQCYIPTVSRNQQPAPALAGTLDSYRIWLIAVATFCATLAGSDA